MAAALIHASLVSPADAEPARSAGFEIRIERVDERGRLILADGSELCLLGVQIPDVAPEGRHGARWRSAWERSVKSTAFFRRSGPPALQDRYGCSLVVLEDRQGTSLQNHLLTGGWAVVAPLSAHDEDAGGAMLRLEHQARLAERGMWADRENLLKATDDLSGWIGKRLLVEGQIRRVSDNDDNLYLNFGDDWRTDFTIRLRRTIAEAEGLDVADLAGRRLRVLGVLQEARGPLMDITHLQQIEFLP